MPTSEGNPARAHVARVGEIRQNREALGNAFFTWYDAAIEQDGALASREKLRIALAAALAMQCPYCIEHYTGACVRAGDGLDELTEILHVAAAIRGGATIMHGLQMRDSAAEHAAAAVKEQP